MHRIVRNLKIADKRAPRRETSNQELLKRAAVKFGAKARAAPI